MIRLQLGHNFFQVPAMEGLMKCPQTRPAMRSLAKRRVGRREFAVSLRRFRQSRSIVVQEGGIVLDQPGASTAARSGIGDQSSAGSLAVAQFDDRRSNAERQPQSGVPRTISPDQFTGTVLDPPQRPDPHPLLQGPGASAIEPVPTPSALRRGHPRRSVPGGTATVRWKQQVAE